MYNPKHYRDKEAEYSARAKAASGASESREFDQLEKSFTALADNEQWLSDNHDKTVRGACGKSHRTSKGLMSVAATWHMMAPITSAHPIFDRDHPVYATF